METTAARREGSAQGKARLEAIAARAVALGCTVRFELTAETAS